MGAKKSAPSEAERRSMMKRILTPEGADTLLALSEAIARMLAETHEELGIHEELEARLRAGIAAATFAIRRYIAVLSAAERSRVAMGPIRHRESQSAESKLIHAHGY
jgi:hypothetical protein